jgi:hypothetical protein
LSTFYASIREHENLRSYLAYSLVSNKSSAMSMLGSTNEEISQEISKYRECGRYSVEFGSGQIISARTSN